MTAHFPVGACDSRTNHTLAYAQGYAQYLTILLLSINGLGVTFNLCTFWTQGGMTGDGDNSLYVYFNIETYYFI